MQQALLMGVISSMHSLFIISAKAFRRSIVSAPKLFEHRMRLHPSASIPEGPEPPFVEDATFNTKTKIVGYLLERIDNIITTKFILAITGGKQVSVIERRLISLPPKYGGLGIPIFSEIAEHEYQNSLFITEKLRDNTIQ